MYACQLYVQGGCDFVVSQLESHSENLRIRRRN